MTVKEAPPMAEGNGARDTPTDRAVEAGERLLEASSKVGNAYADAYQEAVVSLADLREKLSEAAPVDVSKFLPQPGQAKLGTLPEPLQEAAELATRVQEQVLSASKKLGLAYLDAYEQAVLYAVELRQRAAAGSDSTVMSSVAATGAGVTRDATKAYLDGVRQLLV